MGEITVNSIQPSLWHRLRQPLIAMLLGILPLWLFVGMSQTTTVNGQVVQDSSLNVLGVILAIAGLVVVFKVLRDDGAYGHQARWWPRTILAILAGLICILQVVQSLGFYRFVL
jgi:hypothetical protein